jgi:hypothetical protein
MREALHEDETGNRNWAGWELPEAEDVPEETGERPTSNVQRQGIGETFDTAKGRVYAWVVEGQPEPQYVAVLSWARIMLRLDAVRAWLVSQNRQ